MKHLFLAGLLTLLFYACDSSRVYEENRDFENTFWYKDSIPGFNFRIADVSASYNLLINIRNGFDYPFYNMYYQYELIDSLGNSLSKDMQEIILFDPKTGEPLGSGLGDLFDHQQIILEDFQFPFAGQYKLEFKHFMRPDTLPMILSVGARVERTSD